MFVFLGIRIVGQCLVRCGCLGRVLSHIRFVSFSERKPDVLGSRRGSFLLRRADTLLLCWAPSGRGDIDTSLI